ncbi:hypothetical protein DL768_011630 [Monosporascus sp. mg162]|nr:hypothetical protein DL768_011630 [Monosporascus sp. mg162]
MAHWLKHKEACRTAHDIQAQATAITAAGGDIVSTALYASVFNPDRWLSKKSGDLEEFYIPFGTGYHTCSGQHVSRIELSKIIPTIIRDYDIRQVDPKQEGKWKAHLTCVPHSWPCYGEKRKD